MIKKLSKVRLTDTSEIAYLAIDAKGGRAFYALSGMLMVNAGNGPITCEPIESLGTFDTPPEFESLTGTYPSAFIEICPVCNATALILTNDADEACLKCGASYYPESAPDEETGEVIH